MKANTTIHGTLAKRLFITGGLALAVLATLIGFEGTLLRFGTDEASAWECKSLTATPATITEGESTTLTWKFGADTGIWVTIDELPGQKWDGVTGSTSVSPSQTMTYTARAHKKGYAWEPTCTVKVVVEKAPEICPECTLTASVTEITRGEGVTITWTSKDGQTATINNGVGTVDLNGSTTVYPTSNTTYKLTVTSKDGKTIDCEVHIIVNDPPADAPVCTLVANPTTITRGGNSTLTLTSENAETASIDQGVGSTATNTSLSVMPTSDTTYTATVTGPGGTVTCHAPITVEEPIPAPVCEMKADDTLIMKGATTTVRWSSEHTTSVVLTNLSATATTGSATVTPDQTTTYSGIWTGINGETKDCEVTVTVTEPQAGPVCSLNISSTRVNRGDSVTLTWDSQNTTGATFDQGIGVVATSGSKTVVVNDVTTYTGTFTGIDGTTIQCPQTVSINTGGGGGGGSCLNCGDDDDDDDDNGGGGGGGGGSRDPSPNIVLSSTVKNAGGFITLDQVPYTGFEAGPMLTAAFWLGVLMVSAVLAYLLTVLRPVARMRVAHQAQAYTAHTAHHDAFMADIGTAVRNAEPTTFMVAPVAPATAANDTHGNIEELAHHENILLSPEALRAIANHLDATSGDTTHVLRSIFEKAKAEYAREDGWILLSQERTRALIGDDQATASEKPRAQNGNDHVSNGVQPNRVAPQTLTGSNADNAENNMNNNHRTDGASTAQGTANNNPRGVRFDEHRSQTGAKPEVATTRNHSDTPRESYKASPVSVSTLVEWLVAGNEAETYAHVRKATSQGTSIEQFIGEVVRALDDVYKHRLEGNHNPDQELARLTATWSNGDFEKVLGMLVECIDYSYSSNRIGTKVALAKVFEYFRSKSA